MSASGTRLTVNGRTHLLHAPADTTLLEALRGPLRLPGTKCGCGVGECGACNVLVDGAPARACLLLAADLEGCALTTIEGLGDALAPGVVQQAFVETGAIQCGFCTAGMIVAATAMLAETPRPSVDQIRAGLAGTLCRCSGYMKIIAAVQLAAERLA